MELDVRKPILKQLGLIEAISGNREQGLLAVAGDGKRKAISG